MNVCCLGSIIDELADFFKSKNLNYLAYTDFSLNKLIDDKADYIVYLNHEFQLTPESYMYFREKIISLHLSYLPWNQGADPVLWSFVDDTVKGVSITLSGQSVDYFSIIDRKIIDFPLENYYHVGDLRSAEERLRAEVINLFKKAWPNIISGNVKNIIFDEKGSYHSVEDKDRFVVLRNKENIPLSMLDSLAEDYQLSSDFWTKYRKESD